MIKIDFENSTYVCPFCGHVQAYNRSNEWQSRIQPADPGPYVVEEGFEEATFIVHSLRCSNKGCKKVCVTAINQASGKQFDIVPAVTYIHFPEYVPQQIRNDYEEAASIIDKSPKAAATLPRRCLQGMIHDFWNIKEKNLNAEITKLKDKVSSPQWSAIDGLRKLGNIGAHMEGDVNLIVDIDEMKAEKLLRLIKLLIEKWYVNRHEEEELFKDIQETSDEKEAQRKRCDT